MKSIGKYQVIEQLGASAAGTTYKVRDSFRNREFALKVLQTVPGLSPATKEKFCAHLGSCAELVHRHVVKVQDLGEVEEGLFIVSELRTGMDLHQFMQENRELPLGQKLALVAQVAEGLAFAHSREIAHGDLKPSNIFVDGARDITILDFGTSKWLAALLEAGSRPEGLVVNYLAPEQILGEPFTSRSDIFALGLILYEFATGKYPFSAAPGLIPREIVHSEAEPLRKVDPQIPEELEQLVQRALKKDPAERLQTAEEFAAGLYVAAQELRRRAALPAAVEPPAPPRPIPPPIVETVVPALEPVVVPAPPQRAAEPPVRERPQDETGPPLPWTARSYSASAPLSRDTAFSYQQTPAPPPPPQPPAPVAVTSAPVSVTPPPPPPPVANVPPPPSAAAPVRRPQAPQHMRTLAPTTSAKIKKRAIVVVVGLILAAILIGLFMSHQGLRASQNKNASAPVAARPLANPQVATPAGTANTAPQDTASAKPGQSGPNDIGNPAFSAKQTLHGPVRSLWESGRYAEALALVNQVLADDPDNAEAHTWKKKIRDAQEAEAALK